MFILATVAAGVLSSFSASMLTEGSKYHVGKYSNGDKNLNELLSSLTDHLDKLKKSLKNVDSSRSRSELPSDWLDELERCRYEMEDIEDSLNWEHKKQIATKFLQTNINYVKMMQNKLSNIEHETEAGDLSDTQQLNLDLKFSADELLQSRKEDKSRVIEELQITESTGVSIIGICGIGKTFLARSIFVDPRIKKHFTSIFYLPPSPIFDLKSVLHFIQGTRKRYIGQTVLIIMDGMQSMNGNVWMEFRTGCSKLLNRESKVLIITQNPHVANVTGTTKYFLHPLLQKECFSLIHNLANTHGNLRKEDDHAIKHNEKELVDTCKGLPLLATQIGLLLLASEPGNRLDTIKDITTSSLLKVPDLERVLGYLNPVSMIAQDPDPNLRRCLVYCSLFPQDYEFRKENLVQFWMAEGFAPLSREVHYLEKTTNEYFDKLISYSLFQTSALSPGEKPSYKLHGLFHDMAIKLGSKLFWHEHTGNSISLVENPSITSFIRHFSLACDNIENVNMNPLLSSIQRLSSLRTFLLIHESGKKISKNPTFFRSLIRLRVLDLSHTNLTKLEGVSKLKYLHYLDLSHTPLKKLPKLSNSPELQVLKLNHCDKLRKLPKEFKNLTSLISLQVNTTGLSSMPVGIGKLTNLQRLDVFIVGKKKGFKIAELRELNNLKKSLRITRLENVESKQEAQEAMLHNKGKLERVELEWSTLYPTGTEQQVMEGLKPPKNLKELNIRNYRCVNFPEWLSTTEVCGLLETIEFTGCKALPSVGKLKLLTTLRLTAMDFPPGEKGNFPYINTLILCEMPLLDEWIEWAACLPRLKNLQVQCQYLPELSDLTGLKLLEKLEISCSELEELPALPASLKSLVIKGNITLQERCKDGGADWHKIKGIQHFEIDPEPVDASELVDLVPITVSVPPRRFFSGWF